MEPPPWISEVQGRHFEDMLQRILDEYQPEDYDAWLSSDNPNPIANGAILEDVLAARASKIRLLARQAVLECADSKAARIALNTRPRPLREFRNGDQV